MTCRGLGEVQLASNSRERLRSLLQDRREPATADKRALFDEADHLRARP